MPTYRVKKDRENPYVMVNKAIAHDFNISWKAKGILLYFLSRPDDWVVREYEAIQNACDGRDSFRAGVKELIKAGYVRRAQERESTGRFTTAEYEVFEAPLSISILVGVDYPSPEKPSTVKTKLHRGKVVNMGRETYGPAGERLPGEAERFKVEGD